WVLHVPATPVDATVVMLVAPTVVIAFFTCFGILSCRLSVFMLVACGTPHVCHGCRQRPFLSPSSRSARTTGRRFKLPVMLLLYCCFFGLHAASLGFSATAASTSKLLLFMLIRQESEIDIGNFNLI
ncbi:unnamed protein product, partial [Musa acuminata subsp. burmannicoides]